MSWQGVSGLLKKEYNVFFKFQIVIFILWTLLASEKVFSQDVSQKTPSSVSNKTPEKQKEIKLKPAPLPTHDMGSSWLGVREADGVSTYKLKENSKVIGTFHLQKQDKKLNWKELKSKDFFKKFVQRKKEWLSVINIWEWKAHQHRIKKRKDFMELSVLGSYKKVDGKLVFFKERQMFFSDQVYQILVISSEENLLKAKSVRSFFKKAQKIGLSQKKLQHSKHRPEKKHRFHITGSG